MRRNRHDYIAEVDALRATPELRARIAALQSARAPKPRRWGRWLSLAACLVLLVGAAGVALTVAAEALALPLTKIFVGYDAALLAMTCRGFRLYSLSFLLTGFNIFSSGFFTALNDGFVSAVISFLRTLVFQTAVVLVLPALMGTDGIWLAIVVAELLALAVSAWFLWRKRGKYRYA